MSYKVYANFDDADRLIDIGSNVNLRDLSGYEQIDEGEFSRYARAQLEYLEKPKINDDGTHNYRRGNPIRKATDEELAAELAEIESNKLPEEPNPIDVLGRQVAELTIKMMMMEG